MLEDDREKAIRFRGNAPSLTAADDQETSNTLPRRIFLLSPANVGGIRAQRLLHSKSQSGLSQRLRTSHVTLGELFSFMSSLYFRGKLAYAQSFANPPAKLPGVLVVMPSRGLLPPETNLNMDDFQMISTATIDLADERYVRALQRDARLLHEQLGSGTEVVLLGSIATPKYVAPLLEIFGLRLRFPSAFVGRGNMSRGGLLLRCVNENVQLDYIPVGTAVRSGPRPAKLLARPGSIQRKNL